MDALDPNFTAYSLIKLQKLNIRAVLLRREVSSLKAKLPYIDGYRSDTRLKEKPGKTTGPSQESRTEILLLNKEEITDKLKGSIRELKFTEANIEKVIDSLEYRLRESEWRLLRNVYTCCFDNEDLKDIHGSKWQAKLRQIFVEYGGNVK